MKIRLNPLRGRLVVALVISFIFMSLVQAGLLLNALRSGALRLEPLYVLAVACIAGIALVGVARVFKR